MTTMPTLTAGRAASAPDRHWDALIAAVVGFLAVAVGRVQDLFGAVAALRPALLFLALAVGLYVVGQDGPRRVGLLRCRTTAALGCLVGWAALSVLSALNQGVAFRLLVHPFASSVLLYLLVAGSVRGVRDVERLALVYAVSVALYGVLLVSRFGWQADWRHSTQMPYYDANDYATLTVTALPLAAHFLARGSSLARRLMGGGLLVVLGAALARSNSRAGFLALVAVLLCAVFVYRSARLSSRLAAAIAILGALLVLGGERYWGRIESLSDSADYNWTQEGGRLALWNRGLVYARDRPVLGLGANNFGVAEGTISPLAWRQQYNMGLKWSAPHNSYVQAAAELGIPGLLIFLVMLGSGFRAVAAVRRTAPDGAPLAEALVVSLTGFCVGAFFLSLAYIEFPYVLLGLCVGLRKVTQPPGPAWAPVFPARVRGWPITTGTTT